MPSVLCLNDQGGSVMECSENVSGTSEHRSMDTNLLFTKITH